mmetsp:Transcript_31520/g.84113  ORF Transcript_31520/g.84113 Transcript_31520/m.84113 type:complete len:241 (+) Transcript_31520:762-1484(+)
MLHDPGWSSTALFHSGRLEWLSFYFTGRLHLCLRGLRNFRLLRSLVVAASIVKVDGQFCETHRTTGASRRQRRRVLDVIPDALVMKGMTALGYALCLFSIFQNIILAQAAHTCLCLLERSSWRQLVRVLASPVDDEIRVVHGPPQRSEQIEDVRVVVQDGARRYVGVKVNAGLPVQAFVKILLLLRQLVLADNDREVGELQVCLALVLRSPQHDLVEKVVPESAKCSFPGAHVAKLHDWV